MEIWIDDDTDLFVTDSSKSQVHEHASVLHLYCMFIFMWQSLLRVSDAGISILFSFIALFLNLMSKKLSLPALQRFGEALPKNVSTARKLLGRSNDNFTKWVSCQKCSNLYSIEDAKVKLPCGKTESKRCGYVRYANHPQRQHRNPCGFFLMKQVRTSSGSISLYPKGLYCYKSLIASLKEMLQRPNFFERCEHWRKINPMADVYKDIYDGKVWKDFLYVNGSPFLAAPYNFALSLNVDWFQPFKRSTYSAGAIYLAIQNLPRNERYLSENIILVGVIPGPKEPEKTINSFLEPLVHELQLLWKGELVGISNSRTVLVRAAVTCISCDIPAARKVCGFVGHNARLACSKCLKVFPTSTFGKKPDYSGFDRSQWKNRDVTSHRHHSIIHKNSCTRSKQKEIERDYGCRFSVLLELPYFDPIRMTVVDPMHNLLLGTAKRMFSIWMDMKLLGPQELKIIQDRVDNFITPCDVGRIPSKIASGFSGFTAEQWRNWTVIFSLSSLKGILSRQHLNCWHIFVKACHLLCRRAITSQEIADADLLLESFCKTFQELYGREQCTINLHLHGHLCECVRDYGPVYAFWLFSFERLNGIMESFSTNCRDVSLQLMRRFSNIHESGILKWPEEFREDFSSLLESKQYNKGSLMQSPEDYSDQGLIRICPLPPVLESALTPSHLNALQEVLESTSMVSNENEHFSIMPLCSKCMAIKIRDRVLASKRSRFVTCSVVFTKQQHGSDTQLAEIQYFVKCDVTTEGGDIKSLWLAAVSFYYPHQCRVWFGYPTEVWSAVTSPDHHFIPVSHILNRVAYSKQTVDFGRTDSVLVVAPLAL